MQVCWQHIEQYLHYISVTLLIFHCHIINEEVELQM